MFSSLKALFLTRKESDQITSQDNEKCMKQVRNFLRSLNTSKILVGIYLQKYNTTYRSIISIFTFAQSVFIMYNFFLQRRDLLAKKMCSVKRSCSEIDRKFSQARNLSRLTLTG